MAEGTKITNQAREAVTLYDVLYDGQHLPGARCSRGPVMYKMIAVYRKPADKAGLRRHYESVHLSLVRQRPDLRGLVVGWGGDPEYHPVAEMEFDDAAAFAAAAESPQMRTLGKDARVFAGDIMSLATVATD